MIVNTNIIFYKLIIMNCYLIVKVKNKSNNNIKYIKEILKKLNGCDINNINLELLDNNANYNLIKSESNITKIIDSIDVIKQIDDINLNVTGLTNISTIKEIINYFNKNEVLDNLVKNMSSNITINTIDDNLKKDNIKINNNDGTIEINNAVKKVIIDITIKTKYNPTLLEQIFYFTCMISQTLILNIYMLIIDNFLNTKIQIIDIMVFLTLLMFFSSIFGYIFITFFSNSNIPHDLMNMFNNNKFYLLLTSIPSSIFVLVGSIDTSVHILNLISLIGNFIMYLILLLVKPDKNNDNDNKYLYNKYHSFALIISNALMGTFLILYNNSKTGPFGIIFSFISFGITQLINYFLQNEKLNEQHGLDSLYSVYLYATFFEFIYLLNITLITSFSIRDKLNWSLYGKNLYIPILFSFLLSVPRILTYYHKNKFLLNGQSIFTSVFNANSLITMYITVLITPLFDISIKNSTFTYTSIIPLILSLCLMYKILTGKKIYSIIEYYLNHTQLNIHNQNTDPVIGPFHENDSDLNNL
jgi:hypothetical protein